MKPHLKQGASAAKVIARHRTKDAADFESGARIKQPL